MKTVHRVPATVGAKAKKPTKAQKVPAVSIAERYMEVRRLRERVTEVQSRLDAR